FFPIEIPFDLYDSVYLQAVIHPSLNNSLPSFSIASALKVYTGHTAKLSLQTIPIKTTITSLNNEWAMFTKEEEATNIYQWFLGVIDGVNLPLTNSLTTSLMNDFSTINVFTGIQKNINQLIDTNNNQLPKFNCHIIKEGSYDTLVLNYSRGLHYKIWEMPPFKKTDKSYLLINSLTSKIIDLNTIYAFLGKKYYITNNHPSIKKLPIVKLELLYKKKKITTKYQPFECQIGDTLSLIYTLPALPTNYQLQHTLPAGLAYLSNSSQNNITISNGMVNFKKRQIAKKIVQYQLTFIAKQKGEFVVGYGYVFSKKNEPIAQLESKFNIIIE
ncbi:MAG: hypothetical protein ACOVNR_09295, partial [Chitinophagaceae bacterium]